MKRGYMPYYDWSLESKEGKNKHQIDRFDAVSILVETKISFRWLLWSKANAKEHPKWRNMLVFVQV
jgi:hypothetical protein